MALQFSVLIESRVGVLTNLIVGQIDENKLLLL